MSSIATYLNQILRSVYGKDVRQAIHDAISECYDDVNAPALQTEAMQAAVQAKIDAGEMAALTIADGSLTGAKLANGTIQTAKIADGAITEEKLSSDINLDTVPQGVKSAIFNLLANATYTSPDMEDYISTIQLWANEGGGVDTTARIVSENKVLRHGTNYYEELKQYGGVTKQYTLPNPTTVLYPAGIIPTTGDVIVNSDASLVVYDADGTPVNYVNENTGNYNRWAQDASGEMTEYSQSWTISQYSKIAFSVDMRYLDDAYMYDKSTGKVFFAGINTPYYGMSNISQASS